MESLVEVLTLLTLCGIGLFLRSYLRKKGENLATKEDVKIITDKVERVRLEYAERLENIVQVNRLLLEQSKQDHELSLAAIDKRLELHQKAFYMCVGKYVGHTHKELFTGTVYMPTTAECFDWWSKNCLYLSTKTRQAFIDACFSEDRDKIFNATQTIMQDVGSVGITDWRKPDLTEQ